MKITHLETQPVTTITAETKQALLEADLIILGPGDFYTNTIANLIIGEMNQVLSKTRAKILFITNLMTKYGETYNYRLKDFIQDMSHYLDPKLLDFVLINNNLNYSKAALALYQREKAIPIEDNLDQSAVPNAKIIRADMLSRVLAEKQQGDDLTRSMIRHDAQRLATEIKQLLA